MTGNQFLLDAELYLSTALCQQLTAGNTEAVARLEEMLQAVQILLEARTTGLTFH